MKLEFVNSPPVENKPVQYVTNPKEKVIIAEEIAKLLSQKVIVPCEHEEGQVTSPIFLREKSDNSHRLILNLKSLNKDIVYKHFKMDTLITILNLVDKDCHMTKIDIKSAYYSVKIHKDLYLTHYTNSCVCLMV